MQDAYLASNISATTSPFILRGGRYMFDVVATFGGGSVGLERLGPDGSTYLTVITALTVAGGSTLDLAPGQYRISVVTATAVYARVCSIPVGN